MSSKQNQDQQGPSLEVLLAEELQRSSQQRPTPSVSTERPDSESFATRSGPPDSVSAPQRLGRLDTQTPQLRDPPSVNTVPSTNGSGTKAERTSVLPTLGLIDSDQQFPQLSFPKKRRYETKSRLGSGSMGLVDLALDTDIQREVAVKKLRKSSDPSAIARMTDEIRIAGQLEHPNIVPIHDVGVNADGDYFFVMRLVHGITLREIVDGIAAGEPSLCQRFHFAERIRIFRDIVAAVAFAHSQGVLHRDLKPENLMVGIHGEVFVMDWGLATYLSPKDHAVLRGDLGESAGGRGQEVTLKWSKHKSSTPTRPGVVQGTPFYMAPEQTRGESGMAAEVYTLSVILHELLGLSHYLEHRSGLAGVLEGVRSQPVHSLHKANPAPSARVPIEWTHFINKGVGKKVDERFSSVRRMLDTLNKVDEGLFPVECPTTFTKRVLRDLLRVVDRFPIAAYIIPLTVVITVIATLTSYILG